MLAAIPTPTMTIPSCRLKSFWTYKASWPHDTQTVTIPRFRMESFMNKEISLLQRGQVARSDEGVVDSSPSQARHLKCIIVLMKLFAMLLIAASVHAQTLADIARQERERQSRVRPVHTITQVQSNVVEAPKAAIPTAPAADAA